MLWYGLHLKLLGKIPFPLVHVDTGKKFKEMYHFKRKIREGVEIKNIRKLPSY